MSETVRQSLRLLLSGYGYNLYDNKNRARADDLLVREKAAGALADATAALATLRTTYRKRFIPPPTRENPEPPREHVEQLRSLAALQDRLAQLETRIRSMPVPTQDRVWEHFRREQTLLNQLLLYDYNLIAPSQDLRDRIQELTPESWSDTLSVDLHQAADQIDRALRTRAEFLSVPGS